MTGGGEHHGSEALRDAAIAWLVRVQSDEVRAQDWVDLTNWLEADPAHLTAFEVVEALSVDLERGAQDLKVGLSERASATVLHFRPKQSKKAANREGSRSWGVMAVAAAVAAFGLLEPGLLASFQGRPLTYVTLPGETRSLILADGTRIRLDAASRLEVRQGWMKRKAALTRGVAAFDVAKDPGRPFVIAVADQEVRVVGTEFNIRNYGGAVTVTVRRGVVEVRQLDLGRNPIARLTAGQELRHRTETAVSVRRTINPDLAFAWTEGRLVCDDQPLGEIVDYLNHRYAKPIRLSAEARDKRFSGVIALEDQEIVVRRLAQYLSLRVRRSEREITLG